jgi:plasmid stabilization system protein ParE
MKVRYTLRARADLEEIYEYLENHQPTAAQRLKSAIERQIGWLIHFPYMAPATDEAGVRELTLARHPYKIYYEVAGRRCASSTFSMPGEDRRDERLRWPAHLRASPRQQARTH